jgi:hypothetical protein
VVVSLAHKFAKYLDAADRDFSRLASQVRRMPVGVNRLSGRGLLWTRFIAKKFIALLAIRAGGVSGQPRLPDALLAWSRSRPVLLVRLAFGCCRDPVIVDIPFPLGRCSFHLASIFCHGHICSHLACCAGFTRIWLQLTTRRSNFSKSEVVIRHPIMSIAIIWASTAT